MDDVAGKVIREVPPVGGADEHDVGAEPGREPPAVGEAEDVRSVHRACRERLGGCQSELRARQRAHDRQALAVRASRVEVGGQRDRSSGVDERAGRRHRPVEIERGDG